MNRMATSDIENIVRRHKHPRDGSFVEVAFLDDDVVRVGVHLGSAIANTREEPQARVWFGAVDEEGSPIVARLPLSKVEAYTGPVLNSGDLTRTLQGRQHPGEHEANAIRAVQKANS